MITRLPSRGDARRRARCSSLASVLLTLFVWRSVGGPLPLQPQASTRSRALFENASQLTKNADVRISGVNVGKVVEVRPRGLRTEATLSIDARYAPLPDDVRAILRQKTLLGETFVALSPGQPRRRRGWPTAATIRTAQVEPTQPLDRVLGHARPAHARAHARAADQHRRPCSRAAART